MDNIGIAGHVMAFVFWILMAFLIHNDNLKTRNRILELENSLWSMGLIKRSVKQ